MCCLRVAVQIYCLACCVTQKLCVALLPSELPWYQAQGQVGYVWEHCRPFLAGKPDGLLPHNAPLALQCKP